MKSKPMQKHEWTKNTEKNAMYCQKCPQYIFYSKKD